MPRLPGDMLLDVYACADQPERWRKWLDWMCPAMGVRSAIVQILDEDGLRLRQRWCARDSFSATHAELHDRFVNNDQNPRMDLRLVRSPGNDLIEYDRDRFTPGCREYAGFRDRLSRAGLGHSVGLCLPLGRGSSFSLMLHREAGDDRPFAREQEEFLRELAQHLQQMLRLAARTEDDLVQCAMGQGVLDRLRVGVIVCDSGRQVEWLNESAKQLLRTSPSLLERNGRLRCMASGEDRQLASLFDLIDPTRPKAGHGRSLIFGKEGIDALHVLAFPLVLDGAPMPVGRNSRHRLVLLLSEPRKDAAFCPEEIAGLLDLSPAEAALTAALCGGHSLRDYADRRGISVGTARIQLKRVLAKTNTHRQADLVRQICGSVLGYGLPANGMSVERPH